MMTNDRRQSYRPAQIVSWLLLGLTALAFAGSVMLQRLGYGNLFDPSNPQPAEAYGWSTLAAWS